MQIASEDAETVDSFSFEQARALAIEILEVCKDHGGYGGSAPIGHEVGWSVSVVGYAVTPDPPDRTGMLRGLGLENGTLVPIRMVEA